MSAQGKMAEVNAYQEGYAVGLAMGRRESAEVIRGLWRVGRVCPCGAWRGAHLTIPHIDGCLVALALENVGEQP